MQGKLRAIALVDLDVDNHNRMLFDQVSMCLYVSLCVSISPKHTPSARHPLSLLRLSLLARSCSLSLALALRCSRSLSRVQPSLSQPPTYSTVHRTSPVAFRRAKCVVAQNAVISAPASQRARCSLCASHSSVHEYPAAVGRPLESVYESSRHSVNLGTLNLRQRAPSTVRRAGKC